MRLQGFRNMHTHAMQARGVGGDRRELETSDAKARCGSCAGVEQGRILAPALIGSELSTVRKL